jgi:A/G-specific adenine glycosylase
LDTNKKILKWFDTEKRSLPWRNSNKSSIDTYKVWISEIMLQQTTVNAVIPYFKKFINRFPNIDSLAEGKLEEVLSNWAGLGYYSRARNIHKCAGIIVNQYNSVFPKKEMELIKLPGIGDYTAAAICSIAYNQVAIAVDVNIERVISRIYNKHNAKKTEIKFLIRNIIPFDRPGDFTEALMDLGAKVCKARNPSCIICPLKTICETYLVNKDALLKEIKVSKKKQIRYGNCYIISREIDQKYFFIRRPHKGLLGGMLSFSSSDWKEGEGNLSHEKLFENLIKSNNLNKPINVITHTFSHFKLILNIYLLKIIENIDLEGEWIELDEAFTQLPSLMKKVANTI